MDTAGSSVKSPAELSAALVPLVDLEEILVDGATMPEAKPCAHRTMFQQSVFAIIEDDDRNVIGWQMRVRIRCGACGLPFDAVTSSARDPQDSPLGVVFDLVPIVDDGSVSLPDDFTPGYASPEGPQGGTV